MSLGLLAWMGAAHPFPQRVAVQCSDRYVLGLLLRYGKKRLGRSARVLEWSPSTSGQLRQEIEEVPLFGPKPLYLVLGAPKGWVKGLNPHRTTYVVSQQPIANVQGEDYHFSQRTLILRVLASLLELPWSLNDLKRVDWSWARAWSDFEPILVRGKALSWSVSDLMKETSARSYSDIFALIRDREFWSIYFLGQRYGRDWLHRHLMDFSVNVARFQQLRSRKIAVGRVKEILGLTHWELTQVEEAALRTDPADLQSFCNRLILLDPVISRSPQGLDLFLLGAKI